MMTRCILATIMGWVLLASVTIAQTSSPGYVPLPDPGYGLYFHDSEGAPNVATRWGYHDGWEDGRHDRDQGQVASAETKPRFLSPVDRGGHPGSPLEAYQRLYRQAYVHGYSHGSRL